MKLESIENRSKRWIRGRTAKFCWQIFSISVSRFLINNSRLAMTSSSFPWSNIGLMAGASSVWFSVDISVKMYASSWYVNCRVFFTFFSLSAFSGAKFVSGFSGSFVPLPLPNHDETPKILLNFLMLFNMPISGSCVLHLATTRTVFLFSVFVGRQNAQALFVIQNTVHFETRQVQRSQNLLWNRKKYIGKCRWRNYSPPSWPFPNCWQTSTKTVPFSFQPKPWTLTGAEGLEIELARWSTL